MIEITIGEGGNTWVENGTFTIDSAFINDKKKFGVGRRRRIGDPAEIVSILAKFTRLVDHIGKLDLEGGIGLGFITPRDTMGGEFVHKCVITTAASLINTTTTGAVAGERIDVAFCHEVTDDTGDGGGVVGDARDAGVEEKVPGFFGIRIAGEVGENDRVATTKLGNPVWVVEIDAVVAVGFFAGGGEGLDGRGAGYDQKEAKKDK